MVSASNRFNTEFSGSEGFICEHRSPQPFRIHPQDHVIGAVNCAHNDNRFVLTSAEAVAPGTRFGRSYRFCRADKLPNSDPRPTINSITYGRFYRPTPCTNSARSPVCEWTLPPRNGLMLAPNRPKNAIKRPTEDQRKSQLQICGAPF